MAIEKITGRILGTDKQVDYEYDPEDTNSFGVPVADREVNLVRHHRRIAPESVVVLAPVRNDAAGVYQHASKQISLFYERLGPGAQSINFHELWHYAENNILSERDCEIVYRACRKGDTWGSAYLDSDIERAARAFQHYASARASGVQMRPARRGTQQAVFERLYEGTEHAALVKSRRRASRAAITDKIVGVMPVVGMVLFILVMFVVLPHLVTH